MSSFKGVLKKHSKVLSGVRVQVIIVTTGGAEREYTHTTNDKGEFYLPGIRDKMKIGPMTEYTVSQFIYAHYEGEEHEFFEGGLQSDSLNFSPS
ncbi:MAG: hypothetical protein ACI93R_003257 [Flavobacteriales bacterium]|jgi:hypothetical protein